LENLRVAIIGCGGIANAHAGAWRAVGGGSLVACADISKEALDRFGARYEIAGRYLDYPEMLEKEKPDVVHICTHHHLHAQMVLTSAKYAPKAIVCEKPVALSLGDADAMIEACQKAGIVFVVTHQRRLEAANILAKQAIDSGEIGAMTGIFCGLHPWSCLLIDGTHLLDLVFRYMDDCPAKYVFGNVFSHSAKRAWGHQNEDASYGVVHFKNGLSAQFSTGGFENPENKDAYFGLRTGVTGPVYYTMTLMGTKGFVEILGDSREGPPGTPMARLVNTSGERTLLTNTMRSSPSEHWGFMRVVSDLVVSLSTGAPHPLDGRLSRNPLEVITAMGISAKERRPVYLPLDIKENPLLSLIDDDAEAWKTYKEYKNGGI